MRTPAELGAGRAALGICFQEPIQRIEIQVIACRDVGAGFLVEIVENACNIGVRRSCDNDAGHYFRGVASRVAFRVLCSSSEM